MRELDLSQKQRSRIRDASSTSTFRWQIKNSMFFPSSFFVEEFRLHLNETRIHPRSKRGLKLLFKRISTFFYDISSSSSRSGCCLVRGSLFFTSQNVLSVCVRWWSPSSPFPIPSPLLWSLCSFFLVYFLFFRGTSSTILEGGKKTSSNKIHFYTLQTIVSRTVVIQWRVREYQTSPSSTTTNQHHQ